MITTIRSKPTTKENVLVIPLCLTEKSILESQQHLTDHTSSKVWEMRNEALALFEELDEKDSRLILGIISLCNSFLKQKEKERDNKKWH